MSTRTAQVTVLLAAGLMFAAIGIKKATISDPLRYAWAAGAITLFLSLLSDISPEVAGPAAVLVLMAVYWRNRGLIGSSTPLGGGAASTGSQLGGDFSAGNTDFGGGNFAAGNTVVNHSLPNTRG